MASRSARCAAPIDFERLSEPEGRPRGTYMKIVDLVGGLAAGVGIDLSPDEKSAY